ncbi:MAG: hypothetical protein ABI480_17280 [Chitinophagaceae bacterium]
MENLQSEESSLFSMNFDDNTKQQMKSAATIGGIAAIISIAGAALGLVGYIIQRTRPTPVILEGFTNSDMPRGGDNIVFTFLTLVKAVVLFYFLNRFSTLVKNGINGSSSSQVTEGLGALANYFKTIGVLIIIALGLFALAIVIIALTAGMK